MTQATISEIARKADSAYLNMSLAAIELNDARIFDLPVEGAALNLLRKVQAAVDEIIPEVERLVEGREGAEPKHLWVTCSPIDPVWCQRCRKPVTQAAQPCLAQVGSAV